VLAGFDGHLIAEAFLEARTGAATERRDPRLFDAWRRLSTTLGPTSSVRTMVEQGALPLVLALGFDGVRDLDIAAGAAGAATATLGNLSSPIALVVTGWGERLDPYWRHAVTESHKRGATWSLLFNGTQARLVETRRVYSRRYVEFSLDRAMADPRSHAALLEVFGADAFRPTASDPIAPIVRLLHDSEQHAAAVGRSLKEGVLAAAREVVRAIVRRPSAAALGDTFEQALTVIYRLLFLLFAEARGLVPLWHPVYRESYSVAALRESAESSAPPTGLWDAVRAMSHLAHAGCHAGDLHVTAFNGRLFAPSRAPLADRPGLDDEAAKRAVLALTLRPAADRKAAERIAYRDLGVEQLGAVYETILDYKPLLQPGADGRAPIVHLEAGSDARKATGTFYTPQPIAQYLVRRALGPLVEGATAERILGLRVLDPAMGSGAFLVCAGRFLADAYESALIQGSGCHASDIGPAERAGIRRLIAERCLYGVDRNPMAVQLARLSLWLASLAGDKPLSFLDHHLVTGDSLLGAWLNTIRFAPSRRSPRLQTEPSLFGSAFVADALRAALPIRFALERGPSDTAAHVHDKERALAALTGRHSTLARWKRVADLWCAFWFGSAPRPAFGDLSDAILTGRSALPAAAVSRLLDEVDRIATAHRFFHWELEFPEVFFTEQGERLAAPGFDAVIGNPPWEMMRGDHGNEEQRAARRADVVESTRFARDAGVYTCPSTGHPNQYQLFVERSVSLTKPGGRVGLVLPWGIAGDHGSGGLRRMLMTECDVESLVGFENRARLFPIHRSVKFVLLTAARGGPTRRVRCRFGERDVSVLERFDAAGGEAVRGNAVHLTPALLERLSGRDLTIPELRSPLDLRIVERLAASFPSLADPRGWHIRFGRELNASADRAHFGPAGGAVPIVEGKSLEPFRVRRADTRYSLSASAADALLGDRYRRPRLAYRDVASATNRQTLIAAILPAGYASTHTLFCLRTILPSGSQHFLCGLFNSLVVNFLVRLRVSTHVTTAIVEGLPVPREEAGVDSVREVAALARLLARRDDGVARRRLNVLAARLYRLTSEEYAHVLSTFPLLPEAERRLTFQEFKRGN
jgi:hypothetical protein